MTQSLDLILLPLHRQGGQDKPDLPGLYAAKSPRRGARGRSQDCLIIHLELQGTAPLSPKGYSKLIQHLSETYFKTSGSATSAMKVLAEWLNQYLLERNLRGANRGMQSVGVLTLGVLRGDRLYLAQSGSANALLISGQGIQHFQNTESTSRGLGLARATNLHFDQVVIQPKDIFVVSMDPPPTWTTAVLNGLRGLTLMQLHLRLIEQVGPDLKAGLLQISAGTGKLRILRPELTRKQTDPAPTITPPEVKPELPETPVPIAKKLEITPEIQAEQTPPLDETPQPEEKLVVPLSAPAVRKKKSTKTPKSSSNAKPPRERFVGPALKRIVQAFRDTFQQAIRASGELGKRMLPDESVFSLPNSVMAIIAVAVPLFVVAIAAGVYFKRGRESMFNEYYLQAQFSADKAMQLEDAGELRPAWQEVVSYLDQAEAYLVTENSQAMRNYARTVIDNLDYIIRLGYRPAFKTPLPVDAQIVRIVATKGDSEIYLLNAVDGRVFRAILTDQGYELDSEFVCGPVPTPVIVDPLVDIVALPLDNTNKAEIMGMDANGNLLQCLSGGAPPLAYPLPPPDMNWGTPTALVMDSYDIFVLDPLTNAVWIFWGVDELKDRPTLFFDDKIPSMEDVTDITINRDDLFMLHEDGHLTTCNYGFPTRCTDPAVFNDLREGKESSALIDEARFNEIQFAPPPDPSIFLLDPNQHAIYHFSMRLTYQRQYRPQTSLSTDLATAFFISENHQAFIAFGNKVFYAPLP